MVLCWFVVIDIDFRRSQVLQLALWCNVCLESVNV